MAEKIKEVEFDFDAFFDSIREYKEYIRMRYEESIEMEKKDFQP